MTLRTIKCSNERYLKHVLFILRTNDIDAIKAQTFSRIICVGLKKLELAKSNGMEKSETTA